MTSAVDEAGVTAAYRAARDELLALRGDHARAVREFRFPDVGDRWNWGVDWFDAVARGNDRACLTIVEQDESSRSYSYDEMARRSDQVAARLAALGVGRGDSVVLMLGNQVELWESMLAVIKLGAVVMPTTTAVGPGDLVDRMERGAARAVITNAVRGAQVRRRARRLRPHRGRWSRPGGHRHGRLGAPRGGTTTSTSRPPSTRARRPTTGCCSTSPPARRAGPSSSSTPSAPTPSGTSRRCTGSACSPATCTSTSAAPAGPSTRGPRSSRRGLRRRRPSSTTTRRFDPAALLRVLRDPRGHLDLRAADRVADAHQQRPLRGPGLAARGHRRRRTAQPRGHRPGREGVGPDDPRRLRPDRDDGRRRQHARVDRQARLDGSAAAGLPGRRRRPDHEHPCHPG